MFHVPAHKNVSAPASQRVARPSHLACVFLESAEAWRRCRDKPEAAAHAKASLRRARDRAEILIGRGC